MDKLEFLKNKEELKIIARESVLFKSVPQNLEKFEREIDNLEHSVGGEKVLSYLLQLFEEAREQTKVAVSVIKSALTEAA
jgi:hypothetical protein